MNVVVGSRASGKTTALVQWLREAPEDEHRVLVCHNDAHAKALRASNRDIPPTHFVSRSSTFFGSRLRGRPNLVLAMDDADLVLRDLVEGPTGGRLDIVSVTADSVAYDERLPRLQPESRLRASLLRLKARLAGDRRKVTVDPECDAVYVHLADGSVDHQVEMESDIEGLWIIVDVDERGKALGVEVI